MDGVERLLKTTAPKDVSMNNNYSKSTLKKILKDLGTKDMRKAVETMARRVDKHFTHDEEGALGGVGVPGLGNSGGGGHSHASDPATQALIASVWRDLTAEMVRETTRAIDLMEKCYDSNLHLDYTLRDLESTCARAKTSH
jgi:hypothetical protein